MSLRDRLKARFGREPSMQVRMATFAISFDDDGANFVVAPNDFALLKKGEGEWATQEQFLVLQMLAEQGYARTLPNGFEMRSEDVARLGEEEAEILGLPPR